MTLELIAPAKLNLTLEVLARRRDGYHEIASVMQTIDLADTVRISEADDLQLVVGGDQLLGVPLEGPRNLAFKAAHGLAEEAGISVPRARIELEKRIPAGMGLGGGASDAAAVLRGLNRLWRLGLDDEALQRVAARVGSDVPFFLVAGTAVVGGRGEVAEPLPDALEGEYTLFVSDIETEDKTRRMYATLTPADFTDGHRTAVAAESVRRGLPLADVDLYNAFDRHVAEVAPPLASAMALCRDAGLAVFASGSGPGFFARLPLASVPGLLLRELRADWGVRAVETRALPRQSALVLRED